MVSTKARRHTRLIRELNAVSTAIVNGFIVSTGERLPRTQKASVRIRLDPPKFMSRVTEEIEKRAKERADSLEMFSKEAKASEGYRRYQQQRSCKHSNEESHFIGLYTEMTLCLDCGRVLKLYDDGM